MLDMLKGYRTYLQAVLIAVFTVMCHFGMLDAQVYLTLMALLGAGSLASLRAGIQNSK